MDRINGPTAVMDLFGAGKHGLTDGDPLAGVDPTFLDAAWFNGVQEELARAIERLGIVLSASNREQLIQAMRRLAGGNIRTVTADTNITADDAGLVLVNLSAARNINLPAANSAGGRPIRYTLQRTDTAAHLATINRAGSDLINGVALLTLGPSQTISLVSDGASAWYAWGESAAVGIQAFFSSGTFVVPAIARVVRARVWGAGSGGGVFATGAPSAGGSAGGYAEGIYAVTPGAAIAVTVGTGGVANTNGGSSSFGSFCSATGGQTGATNTTTGAPGSGTGGQINLTGGGGGLGIQLAGAALDRGGGQGGGAPFGQGTGIPWVGGSAVAGIFPGGGASGQAAAGSTASGANGLVIVEW